MHGSQTALGKDSAGVGVMLEGRDEIRWNFDWLCEKWSQEAVEFCQRELEREGVTHIQDGWTIAKSGVRDRVASRIVGRDVSQVVLVPRLIPIHHGVTSDILREFVGEPEEVEEVHGNLLLNEGIGRLLDLLTAAGGTAYNNANAYIGVGDSTTAEAASQTELQAATNKVYKGMNATYPVSPGSNGAQSRDWRSDFLSSEANFVWNEWTISAGATGGPPLNAGTTNLNRKVQSLGTKATGTWTLTGTVTIS